LRTGADDANRRLAVAAAIPGDRVVSANAKQMFKSV
jgi:hypothetical protein